MSLSMDLAHVGRMPSEEAIAAGVGGTLARHLRLGASTGSLEDMINARFASKSDYDVVCMSACGCLSSRFVGTFSGAGGFPSFRSIHNVVRSTVTTIHTPSTPLVCPVQPEPGHGELPHI